MTDEAAPHTHQGPPDPVPECPPFPDYAAPSWWQWLTGRPEPEAGDS